MTNFEKIKQMTEAEFAEWLVSCIIPEDPDEDITLYKFGEFAYAEDIEEMLKEEYLGV